MSLHLVVSDYIELHVLFVSRFVFNRALGCNVVAAIVIALTATIHAC